MELNLDDFWTKSEQIKTDIKHSVYGLPLEIQPSSELQQSQLFQRYLSNLSFLEYSNKTTYKIAILNFFLAFFRYGHISWSLGNRVYIGGGLLPSQSRSSSVSCAGKNLTVEFP